MKMSKKKKKWREIWQAAKIKKLKKNERILGDAESFSLKIKKRKKAEISLESNLAKVRQNLKAGGESEENIEMANAKARKKRKWKAQES